MTNPGLVGCLLLGAALAAPAAGLAQTPAAWATPQGRWDAWKQGDFPNAAAHYAALKKAAKGGTRLTWTRLPDWSGLWSAGQFSPEGRALGWGYSFYRLSPTGQIELRPAAPGNPVPERRVLTPAGETFLKGELARQAKGLEWDNLSFCLPAGFPRWLAEPFLREFIVTPNETWMINEQQSETRRIFTDGRDHIAEDARYPKWEGDSIGFWDGDTLIIHTIGVKAGGWSRGQPDYSDQTETVEQVRKNAQGRIEVRLTMYDPATLQKPWHVVFGSFRAEDAERADVRIDMWSCNENNNVKQDENGGTTLILPGQPGYKDPNTLGRPPEG